MLTLMFNQNDSNGNHKMLFDREGDNLCITVLSNDNIQITFDDITTEDLENVLAYLNV